MKTSFIFTAIIVIAVLSASNPAWGSLYAIADDVVDDMGKDYGLSATLTAIDTTPGNGAEFTVDGPGSGTGWWDIGVAWADPDLYPPGMDLSAYDAAVIKVKNLANSGVAAKMYINWGWDYTGGNTTSETGIWSVIGAGESQLFVMDFSTYGIDRSNEIVKIGVHLGMNRPDDDDEPFPAGSQMHVLITPEPASCLLLLCGVGFLVGKKCRHTHT